jgi:hypothetical protein
MHSTGRRKLISLVTGAIVAAGWTAAVALPAQADETAAGTFGYVTVKQTPLSIKDPTLTHCYQTDKDGGAGDLTNNTTAQAALFSDHNCQKPLRQVAPKESAHVLKPVFQSVRFLQSTRAARGNFAYVTIGSVRAPITIQNPIPSLCYQTDQDGGSRDAQNNSTATAALFLDHDCKTPLQEVPPHKNAPALPKIFQSVRFFAVARAPLRPSS